MPEENRGLPWEEWDGFKDLKDGKIQPGPGGGEIPPELIDKINNSVSKDELGNILSGYNDTKDLVFKMSSPLQEGPQHNTDTPYPHDGTTKYAILSVSLKSVMQSNIMIGIEKYVPMTKSWENISGIINLNIGQGLIMKEFEHDISANDRIRINIIEGIMTGIEDITVILNID